jgi:hypothetical protein
LINPLKNPDPYPVEKTFLTSLKKFFMTVLKPVETERLSSFTTLDKLADRMIESFSPLAAHSRNHFVNDIPEQLYIDTDENILASILSGLLHAVVRNAKESCIRISAKIYSNVILVHIKDYNSINYCPVENSLSDLQFMAEKIGGSVSITSQRHNVATFAFSFPNLPLAA